MKNQGFDQLKETLYFEKMENGLEVYILPKEGFNKTFATFTTKYGSVDNDFIPLDNNEYHHVPDGIAHFLEHKLFEKEDGDVFQQFSKQGASANAFTTFNRTAYLFSSTSNVEKNLETLIDMVQSPYFTEKTVEKEKGIIGQEITMYDDNPDWRLYFGVIENMYKHHPVKIDIAGTIESISHITDKLLYECYNTFYHPSNMLLFIVGPVDVENIMKLVRDSQNNKDYKEQSEIKRRFEQEPLEVAEKKKILQMNVQTPKCLVGVKAKDVNLAGVEMLKNELTMNVLLDMLFGKSSDNYYSLYNEGLIDETFSYDFTLESGFGFAMVGGDTDRPDELAERLQKVMMEAKNGEHLTEEALDRTKKKKIGGFLGQLNSPEFIANQFTRYFFNGMNLFEVVPVLEDITFADLKKTANDFMEEERFTVCQVVPKK